MGNEQKRREKGSGNIYQRGDKWIGRLDITDDVGKKPNGTRSFKYFSGSTQSEVKRKIREYLKEGQHISPDAISFGAYLNDWFKTYKKPSLKRSSYDRMEKTIEYQIIPHLGDIQLQSLTSDDIQKMITDLQNEGKSYSTIKKAYDCVGEVLRHATASRHIVWDPMPLVNMPKQSQFTKKEIRIFTQDETRAIVEELGRVYKTGKVVYPYGEAYILMLNTGLREGELIGLTKADWDEANNTIHVVRNVQSVKKRDKDDKTSGYELISNTTKTYSGERTIHLNKAATEAVKRMVARYPDSEYLMCNSNSGIIPPANFIRSFYRVLNNVGIEKTGPHALRHTFASFLFANNVDIKTISKILGHSSVQVTLNTYIHLVRDTGKEAVATLDDFI